VAGRFAEVADVRADGLEDPQAQQPEHGDQGEQLLGGCKQDVIAAVPAGGVRDCYGGFR